MNELSRIKKVDLRTAWKHEASDFTNWMAEPDNLALLSEEIGIELELMQTEAAVGKFSVDILAAEQGNDRKVIIENQLEATDHDHLGKIITYASGLDASTIIWVVKDTREEHRKAIDWLNEHTDSQLAFFLIKIELWQIDKSPLAPKFEIISSPNDWAKTVKQSISSGKVTDVKAKQQQFCSNLREYAQNKQSSLRFQKSYPQHWTNLSIGNSLACVSLTLNSFDEAIRTELYIHDSKDAYNFLFKQRDSIEKELGMKLEWMELPGKKASRVKVERSGLIDHTDEWEKYFDWHIDTAEKFQKVFSKRLKKFKE